MILQTDFNKIIDLLTTVAENTTQKELNIWFYILEKGGITAIASILTLIATLLITNYRASKDRLHQEYLKELENSQIEVRFKNEINTKSVYNQQQYLLQKFNEATKMFSDLYNQIINCSMKAITDATLKDAGFDKPNDEFDYLYIKLQEEYHLITNNIQLSFNSLELDIDTDELNAFFDETNDFISMFPPFKRLILEGKNFDDECFNEIKSRQIKFKKEFYEYCELLNEKEKEILELDRID